jgi:hypothetical protein
LKKGGIGVGSASIVLVFAVLCLTVFSLITFIIANNDKALVDAQAQLVVGYYNADTLAEYIAAEIAAADSLPDRIRNIEIVSGQDNETGAKIASFACPISDNKELYVRLGISGDSYDILSWRMRDTDEWVINDSMEVWLGE